MAEKRAVAVEEFRQLLGSLRKTAKIEDAVEHAAETSETSVSQSDSGNKDALAQGKGAGSTTAETSTAPADRQANGNEPGTQELGQDPAAGAAPSPKKGDASGGKTEVKTVSTTEGNADALEQGKGAGSTISKCAETLTKTAESMEVEAGNLTKQIAQHVIAELAVRKYAEALDAAGSGMAEGLGVDAETGSALAEAIASGEITEDQILDAQDKTDAIEEICEVTGATPEEVIEFGNMIEQAAPADASPEDIAEAAIAHQAAIEEQETLQNLQAEYQNTAKVLRRAEAEKDEFRYAHAQARMAKIMDVLSHYAAALPVEEDLPPKKKKGKADEDEEAGDDAQKSSDKEAGEEQLAAEMLGAGVPEDETGAVMQAIDELKGNVDDDVLKQAIADELTGNVPEISHTASPEELSTQDPKQFVHLYLRTVLQAYRLAKADAEKAQG